jgi:hypothetical protein
MMGRWGPSMHPAAVVERDQEPAGYEFQWRNFRVKRNF